jgi:hypothetical protein
MQYGRYQLRPYEALIRAAHHGSCITRRFEPNTKTTHAAVHRSTQHRTWPHSHQAISHLRRPGRPQLGVRTAPNSGVQCHLRSAQALRLRPQSNLKPSGPRAQLAETDKRERIEQQRETNIVEKRSACPIMTAGWDGRCRYLLRNCEQKKGNVIFGTWPN